jgi:hypothetical protein
MLISSMGFPSGMPAGCWGSGEERSGVFRRKTTTRMASPGPFCSWPANTAATVIGGSPWSCARRAGVWARTGCGGSGGGRVCECRRNSDRGDAAKRERLPRQCTADSRGDSRRMSLRPQSLFQFGNDRGISAAGVNGRRERLRVINRHCVSNPD